MKPETFPLFSLRKLTSTQPAQFCGTAKTHKDEKIDEINVQSINFRLIVAQRGTCTMLLKSFQTI